MTVKIDTRTIESSGVTELYISATPERYAPPDQVAEQLFSGIRNTLKSQNTRILEERVFGTAKAMGALANARSRAYKGQDFDDGVAPSFLVGDEGASLGPIAGVQVHALSGDIQTEVIDLDGMPRGRILRAPNHTIVTLSCVSAPQLTCPKEQARVCLEKAEAALKRCGTSFLSVARTWMWLNDILSWYDDFNSVRSRFFAERGMIGQGTRQSMPASTGIGLGAADGSDCAMDLFAVLKPADSTQYLQAGGKQQCALEYGSAFSRASRAPTPAGQTVFVSGTASINAAGETTNIGDPKGQIDDTIENVRAVLRDMNVTDDDVVHIIAYCKTAEIERVFNSIKGKYNWPWITPICDICRHDLLFEIEATAVAKRIP
ncbi:MAG TPA: Rid family hydrolase [Sedimentisphaerales bacterium]|nr:Rid family hydrolase [Sedimentisphaerales bacterium]